MKKLILLAAFVMLMCGCKQRITTKFGVVKKVESIESYDLNGYYKYKVTVSKDLNAIWKCNVILYTDELYKIGDTVQVTKKK